MNLPLSDLSGILAVQHRVLKNLKKKTGLRQRDWEVLCACQRLFLAKLPFTTAKVYAYLSEAYFLPCIYDSMNLLLEKGYLRVVVPGKPFRPESYELSFSGKILVRECNDRLRCLYEQQDESVAGIALSRVW